MKPSRFIFVLAVLLLLGITASPHVHFSRDNYYPDVPVEAATSWLLEGLGLPSTKNGRALLEIYRGLYNGTGGFIRHVQLKTPKG